MSVFIPGPQSGEGVTGPCAPSLTAPLADREQVQRTARVLKAIADPTRLQLLHLIQTAPGGEACVGNLTEKLGLRQPTISHHLKTMATAGLLSREKRGTWVWYSVDRVGMEAVRRILSSPVASL
ncbi:transcriptional regulator [Streptomyces lunaelactis]|uniref:Transcriptional regulator n=1 Tax=Streptomyces lunaelactis TaxID=1535768 RepID=A0A2R4T8E3_9ACTN|nr:metalloregulator ArsR/SmtB family transcription factor [Streptomyces lunaelactis]AVZ75400.1 transcriptional regulator [Streptomyces lunaelactis]NUK03282.1 helix-turn-helix transcriptional regulator [Streptomyces lunaelactis]NUK07736.1 helix-turn-helix transcriptional regulator [Streptomyces lunaelactis]NUK15842.1 helix-turn-helix transcriptional regulator [Streptomyces lunaelactis]NUK23626.1 helix-turn-helix transcriptional regulator [Streptomyces lunaelactis]